MGAPMTQPATAEEAWIAEEAHRAELRARALQQLEEQRRTNELLEAVVVKLDKTEQAMSSLRDKLADSGLFRMFAKKT